MRDVLAFIGIITCIAILTAILRRLYDFMINAMDTYKKYNQMESIEELQEKTKQLEAVIKGE